MAEGMAVEGDYPTGIGIPEKTPKMADQWSTCLADDAETMAACLHIQVRIHDQPGKAAGSKSDGVNGGFVKCFHDHGGDDPSCQSRGEGMSSFRPA